MDGGSILPKPGANYAPGLHDISNEAYHAAAGISKSGLWTLHTRSPAHYRFGERETSNAFDVGSATHTAILEPETLGRRIARGPEDRRGNRWKDAQAAADAAGLILLTAGDFDDVLRIRDAANRHPIVRRVTAAATIERSAFHVDEETGALCRVRPDAYSPTLKVIADLKTAADGSPQKWRRSVADYGYHVQEAMYSEIWTAAGGGEVDGFLFITVEKSAPFIVSVYELDAAAVAEGYDIYRSALRRYAECLAADHWPGYGESVMTMDIPKWAYRQQETGE